MFAFKHDASTDVNESMSKVPKARYTKDSKLNVTWQGVVKMMLEVITAFMFL